MSADSVITCEDLHRSYKIGKNTIDILKGINLSISRGEKVFLCGASGAGKTTLMYSMAGLEKPKQGRVVIEDTNLYKLPRSKQADFRNQKLGYIFQNYFLLPELTAQENVMIPGMIAKEDVSERALQLLETVGLGHRASHLPAELSGGEQQRVVIARALLNNPMLILADEPTGNLDPETSDEIMALLKEVSHRNRTAVLFATHDYRLIEKYPARIIRCLDGRVLDEGHLIQ